MSLLTLLTISKSNTALNTSSRLSTFDIPPYLDNHYIMFPQVLYLQAFLLVWMFTKVLKAVFFGALRAAEVEVRAHSLTFIYSEI